MSVNVKLAGAVLTGIVLAGMAQAQQPATTPAPTPTQATQPRPSAARPSPPTSTADAAQPGETTATYQDWLMRCVIPADRPRACEVVQKLELQGQGLVASIAVGRADPRSPMRMVVQVPEGVWLPAGMTVQIGEQGKQLQLEYKRCAQVCIAEAQLDPDLLQGMKSAAERGSFTFQDGSQSPVTLPISFRGFAPALDASLKP